MSHKNTRIFDQKGEVILIRALYQVSDFHSAPFNTLDPNALSRHSTNYNLDQKYLDQDYMPSRQVCVQESLLFEEGDTMSGISCKLYIYTLQ